MASSSEPLFLSAPPSSSENLQQWRKDVPQKLQILYCSGTTLPLCIFKLRETRTSEKPDRYIPQHIGLGPIHHFRPDIYSKQEQFKLVTAYRILKEYNITSELEKIVQESLVKLVPVAECCYDLSFDLDNDVLAWAFAIDALVLIDVLLKARDGSWWEYMEEVMMIENQIPLVILVIMLDALRPDGDIGLNPTNLIFNFCKRRSPVNFIMQENQHNYKPERQFTLDSGNNYFHLLDCMYRMIVYDDADKVCGVCIQDVGNYCFQFILFLLKFPWEKLGTLINKTSGETPSLLKIDIPSVSLLTRIAKIEFSSTIQGIRHISFSEDMLKFDLPVLNLKSDSELIIRNLVAYEESLFKNGTIKYLYFTDYVDLMCGIIDGVKDVKILREKGIIVGDMHDDEVVKLFNGITKSHVKVDGWKTNLQYTIERVNTYYDNIPSIKVFRHAKKLFLASWKTIVVLFSILSLVLSTYVGVRELYDKLGLGKVQLVIPYATPNNNLLDF